MSRPTSRQRRNLLRQETLFPNSGLTVFWPARAILPDATGSFQERRPQIQEPPTISRSCPASHLEQFDTVMSCSCAPGMCGTCNFQTARNLRILVISCHLLRVFIIATNPFWFKLQAALVQAGDRTVGRARSKNGREGVGRPCKCLSCLA